MHRGAAAEGAGPRFIISINSEEVRTASLTSKCRWMLGLGVLCLAGAMLCLSSAVYLARHGLNRAAPAEILQSESAW
jgi:hypothetical protein